MRTTIFGSKGKFINVFASAIAASRLILCADPLRIPAGANSALLDDGQAKLRILAEWKVESEAAGACPDPQGPLGQGKEDAEQRATRLRNRDGFDAGKEKLRD